MYDSFHKIVATCLIAFLLMSGLFAFGTTGCSGVTDLFDVDIPNGTKERYIDSGATSLHLYDVDATAPVTDTPVQSGTLLQHTLPQGCTLSWDVQAIDPVDYQFWLSQDITITYDSDLFRCNSTYHCHYDGGLYTATLNGSVYEVPVICNSVL